MMVVIEFLLRFRRLIPSILPNSAGTRVLSTNSQIALQSQKAVFSKISAKGELKSGESLIGATSPGKEDEG